MRASAERYDAAVTTAFRWRHRFLKAVGLAPDTLKGIVEADKLRWSRLSDSPAASLRWFLDVSSGFEDVGQRGREQVDDGDEGGGISIAARA